MSHYLHVVKVHSVGGHSMTSNHDWLMSDGTIKTMTNEQALKYKRPPTPVELVACDENHFTLLYVEETSYEHYSVYVRHLDDSYWKAKFSLSDDMYWELNQRNIIRVYPHKETITVYKTTQ